MSVRNLYPQQRPTLNLNFAQSKILDPRITFTRTSTATYVDEDGFIKTADNDVARFDHDPVTGECLGLLIEEGRTNYFHGTQTGSGGTVSDGTATGADGVIAKKFVSAQLDGVRLKFVLFPVLVSACGLARRVGSHSHKCT